MTDSLRELFESLSTYNDHPFRIIRKLFRNGFRAVFHLVQSSNLSHKRTMVGLLVSSDLSKSDYDEIIRRLAFYHPEAQTVNKIYPDKIPFSLIFSSVPLLVFGPRSKMVDWLISMRPGTFDIDFRNNPMDGWEWSQLTSYVDPEGVDLKTSQERLLSRIRILKRDPKERCYVFGTGPSLEKAIDRDWSDGYTVVCNTIVRDPELWDHLHPDFIVAGDAIYHYGHTLFAQAFRRDLRERLQNWDTLFVYPARFHSIVRRELKGLEEHLIPVPTGWWRKVDVDLTRSFGLPNLGNVLGLLLLPLACTLSKQIYLWGFDGRNPNDKLFWSNSEKHSYPEHMDELLRAHPRFFEHHVPATDPNKYVRSVQGDLLDLCLEQAEKRGRTFVMMHRSWTPTLQKRVREEQ